MGVVRGAMEGHMGVHGEGRVGRGWQLRRKRRYTAREGWWGGGTQQGEGGGSNGEA